MRCAAPRVYAGCCQPLVSLAGRQRHQVEFAVLSRLQHTGLAAQPVWNPWSQLLQLTSRPRVLHCESPVSQHTPLRSTNSSQCRQACCCGQPPSSACAASHDPKCSQHCCLSSTSSCGCLAHYTQHSSRTQQVLGLAPWQAALAHRDKCIDAPR